MDADERVLAAFSELECSGGPFSEMSVLGALRTLARTIQGSGQDLPSCLHAEMLAFQLVENCLGTDTMWGTYYGPMAVGQDAEGNRVDIPSLDSVSAEIITYWEQRARLAQHPILRARYADLVWDFGRKVTGTQAPVEMAHIVIDSNVAMVEHRLHASKGIVPVKLRRALSLALSTNDSQRIPRVREGVLATKPDGYWPHWRLVYDELLKTKRAGLTDSERQGLIRGIEEELSRELQAAEPNGTQVENLTLWLADYHRSQEPDEMRRVIEAYAGFSHRILNSSPGLVASDQLERLHEICRRYGLTQEARALTRRLEEVGDRVLNDMHTVTHSMDIPKEQMDGYLNALGRGTLTDALTRIAVVFIEEPEEVRRSLERLTSIAPLQFMITKRVTNRDGIAIAEVGALREDPDGNLVYHTGQRMGLSCTFLRCAMEHVKRRFDLKAEDICGYLYESPLFLEHHRALVLRGLRAYLEGEFDVCVHMLIPQIERVVRRLATKCGACIYTYRGGCGGGFQLRSLHELLKDECVERSLTEGTSLYLASLLTDRRGWNVRNNVCHGIPQSDDFTAVIADRVVHALLVLGALREAPSTDGELPQGE